MSGVETVISCTILLEYLKNHIEATSIIYFEQSKDRRPMSVCNEYCLYSITPLILGKFKIPDVEAIRSQGTYYANCVLNLTYYG